MIAISRVPEVIEALTALGTADPELSGVAVADGPEVSDTQAQDWLIFGFDGDPSGDFQAAQSVSTAAGLGTRREEEFEITAAAIANRGDTDVVAARDRVLGIGARVAQWLQTDPALGLTELQAGTGAMRLIQNQTEDGAQVVLLMTVSGRGFI
ncbi:hypothetical protein KVH22_30035 [Streptomyces olivaceus]|uniref:hypothetical protein n=1 Tax=Streptomyces olivaceus TaxID=47716 RepID=UPI001CCBAB63|nr:hypothetical protein [Streptomyces olivaceus]MBZ6259760.1 hypothetical protein [Streptomyces olivaceus]